MKFHHATIQLLPHDYVSWLFRNCGKRSGHTGVDMGFAGANPAVSTWDSGTATFSFTDECLFCVAATRAGPLKLPMPDARTTLAPFYLPHVAGRQRTTFMSHTHTQVLFHRLPTTRLRQSLASDWLDLDGFAVSDFGVLMKGLDFPRCTFSQLVHLELWIDRTLNTTPGLSAVRILST